MQISSPDVAIFFGDEEGRQKSCKSVILNKFLRIWCNREILSDVNVTHLIPKCYRQNMLIVSNAFVPVI